MVEGARAVCPFSLCAWTTLSPPASLSRTLVASELLSYSWNNIGTIPLPPFCSDAAAGAAAAVAATVAAAVQPLQQQAARWAAARALALQPARPAAAAAAARAALLRRGQRGMPPCASWSWDCLATGDDCARLLRVVAEMVDFIGLGLQLGQFNNEK